MDARIHIERTIPAAVSRLKVGVVLKQVEPSDLWAGSADARARANVHVEAMRSAWFVQHLGTWGIDLNKVWPKPDTIDWTLFDRRFQWIADRRLENVVIVCYGAPDWATTPTKNYRQLKQEYEQAWSDFCVMAIERAISLGVSVKIAVCWNELKGDGLYGGDWDIVTYTRRYNTWYTTIRSRPALDKLLLAGPYLILENKTADDTVITRRNLSTLDYWYSNAIDADIISVDHALAHAGTAPLTPLVYMDQTHVFGTIGRQLCARYPGHEIMMSEHYPMSDTKLYADLDIDFQAACYASMLRHEALSGISYAFSWGLTGDGRYAPGGCIASWLTDTRALSGEGAATPTGILPGDPTPLYYVHRHFHEYFGDGRPLYDTESSDPFVEILASDTATMIINKRPEPINVRLGGERIGIGRYGIKMIVEQVKPTVEDMARRIAREECGRLTKDLLTVMRGERERVVGILGEAVRQIGGQS